MSVATGIREAATNADRVSDRPLIGLTHDLLKEHLSGSLDPELKAFLHYMKNVETQGSKTLIGKFLVLRNVDGLREVYFVFPQVINVGTPQRQKLSDPKTIPTEVKVLIRERCGAVALKFVRDDGHAGIAILGTLGRIGATCALGVVEDVVQ